MSTYRFPSPPVQWIDRAMFFLSNPGIAVDNNDEYEFPLAHDFPLPANTDAFVVELRARVIGASDVPGGQIAVKVIQPSVPDGDFQEIQETVTSSQPEGRTFRAGYDDPAPAPLVFEVGKRQDGTAVTVTGLPIRLKVNNGSLVGAGTTNVGVEISAWVQCAIAV